MTGVIIFICLLSWGTATEHYLYLTSSSHIITQWWKLITYPFTCSGILSLSGEIFIIIYAYRSSISTGSKRMFFIPWCIWCIIGGGIFYITSYIIHPVSDLETEILSSTILPSLAYMSMLSSAAPFTHMFFLTPRVRLWKITFILCLFTIGFIALQYHIILTISYTITCCIAAIFGFVIRHIEIHGSHSHNRIITAEDYENFLHKNEEQRKLDAILEKISRIGYKNLSRSEKEFLRSISTKDK